VHYRLPPKFLTILLAGYIGLLGFCATMALGVCAATAIFGPALPNCPAHMDFFGIWSWARFEIERRP